MSEVTLKHNLPQLIASLDKARRVAGPAAMKQALTRTAKKAFTVVKKKAAEEMGVAQKHIVNKRNRQLFLKLPGKSVGSSDWRASVVSTGRPLPMELFKGTTQTASGVRSSAYGKRRTYPKTFMATLPNGHRGVMVRSKSNDGKIRTVYGPSVPKTTILPVFETAVQDLVNAELPVQFDRALEYQLLKISKGGK